MTKITKDFYQTKNRRSIKGLLWLFALLIGIQMSWGQAQVLGAFKEIDGGFEGQTNGAIANVSAYGAVANAWTSQGGGSFPATITEDVAIARSGKKCYVYTATGGAKYNYSPLLVNNPFVTSTATMYTIQFYNKHTTGTDAVSNILQKLAYTGSNSTATERFYSAGTSISYAMNTWVKTYYTFTTSTLSATGTNCAGLRSVGSVTIGGVVDDYVVYAGALDTTVPDAPTLPTVTGLNVSWTAPVVGTGNGVDGGGYMVVRYATNPAADNDPNPNGIYAVGNTITNGTGSLVGKVVYIGAATSFTDAIAGSVSGSDYYKIYSVDKAFNYSPEITGTAPVLTAQTINFSSFTTPVTYGDATFELSATASSGLPVSFASSNTAVATVSGTTVTIVGAGSAIVTASQAGDATYAVATPVQQTLTVDKIALTLSGATAQNKVYDGTTAAVVTGGSLTGIINSDSVTVTTGTFADANVATGVVVTAVLTGTKAGNYSLTQPGGLTADITKASQTITLAATASKYSNFADYSPGATSASSGINPIIYASSNLAVATIVNNKVHYIGAGTTTITASQAASTNYNAATDVTQTLTVDASNPKRNVLYATYNKSVTMNTTASTYDNDPVIRMLNNENFNVTVVATDANGINLPASFSGYDLLVVQESIGGGDAVLQPAGKLGIKNLTIPVIYNKSFALKTGRAVTTASTGAAHTTFLSVDVTGNTSNALYSGIDVSSNSVPLLKSRSDDTASTTVDSNGIVIVNNLELTTTGTLKATVSDISNANKAILINDIPAGTQFGTVVTDVCPSRMIAFGFNYGAICESNGKNVTNEFLTLWRNAAYMLTEQNTPTTLYINPDNHQTITFGALPSKIVGDANFTLAATASSGLAVTYASSNTAVATVSGNTVTIVGAGSTTITASQVGGGATTTTAYWYAAPDVTQTLNVSASTIWTTAWSNGTPDATVGAIIDGDYSTTTNGGGFTSKKLIVNATRSLTVNSGTNLTVQDEVINNGSLVVENNANLIQVNNTTNTGNVTVNRSSNPLYRLDYTLWSSPVSGTQTLVQFSPLTSQTPTNRFYTYDTVNNQYVNTNVPTTATFGQATGYLIRMPNEDPSLSGTGTPYYLGTNQITYNGVFTGVLNNGTISKTISDNGSGYNMIGNPYSSTLSADAFMTTNNASIESTLYFWRKTNLAGGSAYATYTPIGGAGTNASASGVILTPNGTIQVGQGFFVKAKTGATAVSFTNAMREPSPTSTQFFKTKKADQLDRVWLNLSNPSGAFSQALVGYTANATVGVDAYDGQYFNDSPVALTSNINGGEYTVQGRPAFDATDIVPLNFKTDVAGDYTIAIDHSEGVFAAGQSVILADAATGTETDLTTSSYTFAAAAGTANTRFSLKYQKTLGTNKAVFSENNVTVYKNKGTLYVNAGDATIANIKVYDVQGKLVAELKNGKATSATIANLKATNQVLVVKITSQDNKVVTKKVVN